MLLKHAISKAKVAYNAIRNTVGCYSFLLCIKISDKIVSTCKIKSNTYFKIKTKKTSFFSVMSQD